MTVDQWLYVPAKLHPTVLEDADGLVGHAPTSRTRMRTAHGRPTAGVLFDVPQGHPRLLCAPAQLRRHLGAAHAGVLLRPAAAARNGAGN